MIEARTHRKRGGLTGQGIIQPLSEGLQPTNNWEAFQIQSNTRERPGKPRRPTETRLDAFLSSHSYDEFCEGKVAQHPAFQGCMQVLLEELDEDPPKDTGRGVSPAPSASVERISGPMSGHLKVLYRVLQGN